VNKLKPSYWELSSSLINSLNVNSIEYCHWKSNINVEKAMSGFDDLDLLISRNHFNRCQIILSELGFKEALNSIQNIHSVRHYYGFDQLTGEILHVHLYVSIITGPSWTKGYTFSIEQEYLSSSTLDDNLKIRLPQKEYELALFLIRICLKYTSLLEAPLVMFSRKSIMTEIKYLSEGSSIDLTSEIFNRLIGSNNNLLFSSIINANTNLYKIIVTAFRVRFRLKRWRTLSKFKQINNSILQLSYRFINKMLLKKKKKFANGGLLISFVGLDASGKSSMLNEAGSWLSKSFNVKKIHLGRPRSSIITLLPNLLIKLNKKLKGNKRISNSYDNKKKQSLIFVVRQLVLAYDRYKLVLKARNLSRKGYVVLIDRYKSENIGIMDSHKLDPNNFNSFKKYLAMIENNLYCKMGMPSLILHLKVPIDVAIKRNNDRIKLDKESTAELKLRYGINKNLVYKANNYHVVDSNKDYNKVLTKIKVLIWKSI
jgi:thymidylate kinase